MAYDKVVDSGALETKLAAIADAIRGKTGGANALTLEQMVTEIAGIETGGGSSGGNANTYSGELITDAVTNIYAAGLTLDLGLPSRAKWFFMWFDRDDFLAIETPGNNYYGIVVMFPVTLSEIIPIRYNASGVVLDTADRFFLVGSYYNATTGSDSGYGSVGLSNFVNANTSVWAANEDGTITISRFGTSATYLFAGTYHWIAGC